MRHTAGRRARRIPDVDRPARRWRLIGSPEVVGLDEHDMRRTMQICVLGHLEAHVDDRPVALGGPKQRAVLAMLGLEANRTVSADRLAAGLWGEELPPSAAKMIQTYVSRLRHAMADDHGAAILTHGRGYELRIDPEFVDVHRLERLVADAARSNMEEQPGHAAREALALFRGEPLADLVDEPFAATEIPRLERSAGDGGRVGDRRRPGRRPTSGGSRRDRSAAWAQSDAGAPARAADAGALPMRAAGRGARRVPTRPPHAGRRDRRRARARPQAPARGDPAAGPGTGRQAGRARAPARARRLRVAAAGRSRA